MLDGETDCHPASVSVGLPEYDWSRATPAAMTSRHRAPPATAATRSATVAFGSARVPNACTISGSSELTGCQPFGGLIGVFAAAPSHLMPTSAASEHSVDVPSCQWPLTRVALPVWGWPQ